MRKLYAGFACVLVLAAWASGCGKAQTITPPAVTLKKIGEACMDDSECGSVLGDMQVVTLCRASVCTKPCTGQLDCPVGFDCGLQAAGDHSPTCYPSVANPAMGGFGTNCSVASMDPTGGPACSMNPSPCASGFICLAALKCDPNSYCTRSCMHDTDCLPNFFCGVDTYSKDMTHVCLKRGYCDDCSFDAQCPDGWICATDAKKGHFCAKPCNDANGDGDCPQPQGASAFQKCMKDVGGRGPVCQPAPVLGQKTANLCHGQSAVAGFKGGEICSGCRFGVPSDCTLKDSFCRIDEFTLESFCTKRCTLTVKNGTGSDDCPMGSFCSIGVPPSSLSNGTAQGLCQGDPSQADITCYP